MPIVLVVHCSREQDLNVIEVTDKLEIHSGPVFFSPCGYHLMIEDDQRFSLSLDTKVNFSRPSIDVLFSSAAEIFANGCIGIILSGANNDGTEGLGQIKKNGGLTIAQCPDSSHVDVMPQNAIDKGVVDKICTPFEIATLLTELSSLNLN